MRKNIIFTLLVVVTICTIILNIQISLGDNLASSSVSLNNIEALATVEANEIMVRRPCDNGVDMAKMCEYDMNATPLEMCKIEEEETCDGEDIWGTGSGQTDYCKEHGCEFRNITGAAYSTCIRCGAMKYEGDQHVHKWEYSGVVSNDPPKYIWTCKTCYSYGYSSSPFIKP